MLCRGSGWLPVLLVILTVATFITTYIITVVRGDAPAFFPYISDTGANPPESCVFGQFLNVAAIIAIFVIFIRYKEVLSLVQNESVILTRLNIVSLIIGIASAIGMSVVANFQESTVLIMHVIGALVLFVGGTLYELLQVVLSILMNPEYNGKWIGRIRLSIWCFTLFALVSAFTSSAVASHQGHKKLSDTLLSQTPWNTTDPGYTAHIVSTFSEWIMAASFLCFFLTFTCEFQKVTVRVTTHLHVMHLDEAPIYPDESTRLLL